MFNQNYEVNVVGVLNSGMSVYFWEGISSKMTVYTLSGYLTPNDLISIMCYASNFNAVQLFINMPWHF